MKKIIILLSVITLISTSCYHHRIDGDGWIVEEERNVEEFDHVIAEGVFKVYVSQGSRYEVIVETDENLQNIVMVKNTRNKLFIELEDNVNFDATRMNIYVTAPNYNYIEIDGVVDLKSENEIETEDLKISNNGVGHIDLDLQSEFLEVNLNGVGSIKLSGNALYMDAYNDGVGNIEAYNMISHSVRLVNSGVGKSEIFVTENLDVTINGVGNVYYKGDPDHINSNISGVGRLKKK